MCKEVIAMIYEAVMNYLKSEYESGMTQEEMAKKHGVSQGQIQRVLSGERTTAGFTLQTLDKMFPRAEIFLDGITQNITNSGNANFAQTISGNIDQSRHGTERNDGGLINRIISEVLDHEDFNAEEKIKFMKFVKNIEDLQ
jgi:transcriptional regulator with XRE-family HTH domain